ncbi:uncharacterized protein LY89DRAFT_87094 [Mollisia scopiformis]|uniref:Uncharacterized protein n=1 Tax=Mollisia scopiformis TaxID=149040 RepID=A0A194X8R4_MOLSC|nr:uncharacterized protein LY89DRAFT_87094 [Mollisia scopiformis]KUJ16566.1 hypothetical protein LY89DRAFT_87094 [Mollisia scopiformis]
MTVANNATSGSHDRQSLVRQKFGFEFSSTRSRSLRIYHKVFAQLFSQQLRSPLRLSISTRLSTKNQAATMSDSSSSTATQESSAPKWLTRSNSSMMNLLNNYFEDKEQPRPSNLYRFYWLCCHHPKSTLLSSPSKIQCLLRNHLMDSQCGRCAHKICPSCKRIAQQESADMGVGEQDLAEVLETADARSSS